ncbi:CBS domain-containing protein [Paenibacillus sp. KACC 21273]|uniref:CBS domain-containing protein n=1 Tax=Paenibacillus sp. KACC 21273 TaxID=3025665 RepID=UPI002366AA40|nr:CBS domain-containing protein [Paenibacillus sp. KACC 21273]WDF49058.1 CBS domain-containing protein [Paenibacillus sp. KACC 21273]
MISQMLKPLLRQVKKYEVTPMQTATMPEPPHEPEETLTLTDLLRSAPHVTTKQTCEQTLKVMFSYPEAESIVVCDKLHRPVGLVMCGRFFFRVNGRAGMDGFYMQRVVKLMTQKPLIVDVRASVSDVQQRAEQRAEYFRNDSIIVTEQERVLGIITATDLRHGYRS